jgi:curli production assembly/transport component CsgG
MNQPTKTQSARLGEQTKLTAELRRLPTPREKIVAAVYKFRDQTGQYKPSETGANWSTAVSQGTTNILLKALEESGWFVPIERENVGNLLNERKIIRSGMAQYKNEADNLPPLLFAGIILEGGIVSYDANTITGGAGLRFFGAGGSGQYRQDRVTVYLRAVQPSPEKS